MADKTYLFFDSEQRSGGTVSAPSYKISHGGLRDVTRLALQSVVIPYTWYTVNSTNNKIDIDQGGEVNVTLAPGNYTAAGLATALQAAINATTLAGFTVTFNATNYKYTITDGAAFDILWATGTNADESLADIMGFNGADTGSATSHTGPMVASLVTDTIYIKSSVLSGAIMEGPYKDGAKKNIVFEVPVGVNPGEVINYSPQYEHDFYFSKDWTMDILDLALVYSDGSAVDLNGLGWKISFAAERN